MAYVIPDYAAFIARFPIFSDTATYPQPVVEALIAEAANNIDTSWLETDYTPAILYLTAHILTLDNSSAGDIPEVGGPSVITSESFAGMSTSYAKTQGGPGSASNSSFGLTSYGQRYYNLLRKNKPPVTVA